MATTRPAPKGWRRANKDWHEIAIWNYEAFFEATYTETFERTDREYAYMLGQVMSTYFDKEPEDQSGADLKNIQSMFNDLHATPWSRVRSRIEKEQVAQRELSGNDLSDIASSMVQGYIRGLPSVAGGVE